MSGSYGSKRSASCVGLQRAQSSSSLPPASLLSTPAGGISATSTHKKHGLASSSSTRNLTTVTQQSGGLAPPPDDFQVDDEIFNLPPTESRGAPDGCGLDPAVEALTKKGWLMKQGATKEWHKYWFVLQDVALLFYRDPKAETKGFLDGIIDLSQVQRIGKQDLPRHFGFYVRTYDGKVTLFSAITDGIRKNWIASLQKAANVSPSAAVTSGSTSQGSGGTGSTGPGAPGGTGAGGGYTVKELDVITTTRIVRTSTHTTSPQQPNIVNKICVPKVPALPPPLTLQSSTTTMSFSSYNEDSDEEDEDEDSDEGEEGEEESSCDEEEVTSEESDNESNNRKDVVGMKSDTGGGGIKKKQFIQPTIIAPTASSTPSTSPSLHNQVIETLPEMRTSVDQRFSTRGCRVSNNNNSSSSSSNNAKSRAADILETEVDSLKTKLAQAQNDLRSLHQTPLSKQSPKISATVSASEPSGRPIDSTPSALSEYNRNRVSAGGGASTTTNTTDSSFSSHHAESNGELNKAKSTIAKQSSEIASLTSEISRNQVQLSAQLKTLQGEKEANNELKLKVEDLGTELKSLKDQLRVAEGAASREVEAASEMRRDFEIQMGNLETEVDKWKVLHESLYLQFKRESRSWKDEVGRLERKAADECEEAVDEVRKKSRIIADLSEQLKESDDRIQDLSLELDALKEKQSTDFATNNQESISKFVVSMEEKFAATLKSEKEQLELAFKERLREHEIYEKQQRLVTADVNATASSFAGQLTSVRQREEAQEEEERKRSGGSEIDPGERKVSEELTVAALPTTAFCPTTTNPGSVKRRIKRPSLVKINSMTDLLSLKVPSVEAIQTMEREDMTEKFLVLLDHFYASVDEIRKLRVKLRESQDNNDALEIDKVGFEESFKRTIVMQEQQEKAMTRRIEDLTNKLLSAERTIRQLKESRKHSKRKDSNLGLASAKLDL